MDTLGFGLGLRPVHYPHIFNEQPAIDWFEVISENFMDTDGKAKRNLARIREHYPVVMHGVSLSIGTVDPLNSEYLQKLKKLVQWLQPAWISDHLCWTGVAHRNTHDLLPLPYTEEALRHVVKRIRQVQDFLERPIALENPSTYLEFKSSTMPEAEFIARMVEESGCRLLLDVNNVYVTCFNHRLDTRQYLDALPLDRVQQIHLSGHDNRGTHIIDTHDAPVVDDVWTLYRHVVHGIVQQTGRVPNTMIEWDDHIPAFEVLSAELEKARVTAGDAQAQIKNPNQADTLPDFTSRHFPAPEIVTTALADEQTRLQDAITRHPENPPENWIISKENFPPAAQLAVYANAYRWRLRDVVAEDYPVLAHWLGAEKFTALIHDFVKTEPSRHFNIGRYASGLPDFIARQSTNPETKIAQEICQLETVLCQLADAEETPALAAEDLQALTPETLMQSVLRPRAAAQLLEFSHAINAYYRDVMEEKHPAPPAAGKSWLAVFRHDDALWRMELEEQEFRLLQLIFDGQTLAAALETLQAENGDAEALAVALSGWFGRWMQHHLLSRIEEASVGANVEVDAKSHTKPRAKASKKTGGHAHVPA